MSESAEVPDFVEVVQLPRWYRTVRPLWSYFTLTSVLSLILTGFLAAIGITFQLVVGKPFDPIAILLPCVTFFGFSFAFCSIGTLPQSLFLASWHRLHEIRLRGSTIEIQRRSGTVSADMDRAQWRVTHFPADV